MHPDAEKAVKNANPGTKLQLCAEPDVLDIDNGCSYDLNKRDFFGSIYNVQGQEELGGAVSW